MKDQNNVSLLNSLEQLPTSDLDVILHSELEKEFPAEETVQLILKILREREVDFPVVSNPQIDKAWDKYHKETGRNPVGFQLPMIKAAVILILCGLLLYALPQETHAEKLLNRVVAWTDNMFALLSQWNHGQSSKEYVFQAEHPGLLKLYDAVSELGVATPVIPMWISDEYELDVLDYSTSPAITKIAAVFVGNGKEAIFELNIYSNSIPREFHKSDAEAIPYENNGVTYYIFQNNDLWTVVWANDNVDCAIAIDCSESDLYRIVDSIYASEE